MGEALGGGERQGFLCFFRRGKRQNRESNHRGGGCRRQGHTRHVSGVPHEGNLRPGTGDAPRHADAALDPLADRSHPQLLLQPHPPPRPGPEHRADLLVRLPQPPQQRRARPGHPREGGGNDRRAPHRGNLADDGDRREHHRGGDRGRDVGFRRFEVVLRKGCPAGDLVRLREEELTNQNISEHGMRCLIPRVERVIVRCTNTIHSAFLDCCAFVAGSDRSGLSPGGCACVSRTMRERRNGRNGAKRTASAAATCLRRRPSRRPSETTNTGGFQTTQKTAREKAPHGAALLSVDLGAEGIFSFFCHASSEKLGVEATAVCVVPNHPFVSSRTVVLVVHGGLVPKSIHVHASVPPLCRIGPIQFDRFCSVSVLFCGICMCLCIRDTHGWGPRHRLFKQFLVPSTTQNFFCSRQ
mmetsp:Transcript_8489/g.17700  ORF Transcript_8489/g.17700 Transcript_8489/m.17700 type:complete len:412 (-) Transcript_8489:216-1451(-)